MKLHLSVIGKLGIVDKFKSTILGQTNHGEPAINERPAVYDSLDSFIFLVKADEHFNWFIYSQLVVPLGQYLLRR